MKLGPYFEFIENAINEAMVDEIGNKILDSLVNIERAVLPVVMRHTQGRLNPEQARQDITRTYWEMFGG